MRILLFILGVSAATAASHGATMHNMNSRFLAPLTVGLKRAMNDRRRPQSTFTTLQNDLSPVPIAIDACDFLDKNINVNMNMNSRGGASSPVCTSCTPPARFLKWAYTACGLATTAAWSTIVYTTIRSNQPPGAMMPCWQHKLFARIGGMGPVPLFVAGFGVLACSAGKATDSWQQLGTPTCRRHNLALATTGVGMSLWTYFAETVTKIPGTGTSHQVYTGAMKWGLMGCFGSGAALAAAVWARSLPDDVRSNPLQWPGRIADGVSKSLVSLAPANRDDPVNVKYALLTTSFLVFTGMQTVCNMPVAVMPSWLSRRLSRAFAAWTLLGATTSFDLMEAAESGKLLVESNYRTLSNGIKGFGLIYFASRLGVFFDPSFPKHFGVVNQVPGLAVAAALMVGLTLRSDKE